MKAKTVYSYDRHRALNLVLALRHRENADTYEPDIARTETFIDSVFNEYEGLVHVDPVNFVFAIPTRADKSSREYWLEVYDFLPALQHLSLEDAFQVLASLPPFKIDEYGKPGQPATGAILFVPIFTDMIKDYKNKLALKRAVRKRINDAATFAHRRLGARYIGLGATLPKLTKFGKLIKADMVTTTGHGGTVWLIVKTYQKVLKKLTQNERSKLKLGFIGGGSIGYSAAETLLKIYPETEVVLFDIRSKVNKHNYNKLQKLGYKVSIAASNKELIKECQVIVSAVTSKIKHTGLDLSGKYIIDDSQPGSFDRQSVEDAGGQLVWVVGKDKSEARFVSRQTGYSYGAHGLHSASDVWGCEAEVATLAQYGRYDLAITSDVSPESVMQIGELLDFAGITAAEFQSFGRLNRPTSRR